MKRLIIIEIPEEEDEERVDQLFEDIEKLIAGRVAYNDLTMMEVPECST